MTSIVQHSAFLRLPAEIRVDILSYVLVPEPNPGFILFNTPNQPRTGLIDDAYSSAAQLELLLTCRQFRDDFTRLAFRRTSFVITDTFTPVPKQMEKLQSYHMESIRHLSVVCGARQFRDMVHWTKYPFNMPALRLETLNVVFHRSGHWHYVSDFTTDMVALLRRLQNVETLRFIRNGANVKGFFKTWCNRLRGLVLKEDHRYRYDDPDAPQLPRHWWDWSYDVEEQAFALRAKTPMEIVDEVVYLERVKPRIDELMGEMEREEVDPDPKATNGWA